MQNFRAPVCYNGGMTPQEFWTAYAGEIMPGDFMCRYQSRNPRRCAERYVSRLPAFLGVARRSTTWQETFAAYRQHGREEVIAGLTAYLEETRATWESALDTRDAQERIEREQTEWEQAERERQENEQAEWERAHQPDAGSSPANAPSAEFSAPTATLPPTLADVPSAESPASSVTITSPDPVDTNAAEAPQSTDAADAAQAQGG